MKGYGIWVFVGIVVLCLLISWGSYNSLVGMEESVNGSWSEVQNQLKRRNDLIPNLVSTVKGYAAHEASTFAAVTEARAKIGQVVQLDASKIAGDVALQKKLLEAQQGLNASLGRLIAVAENYPQLKADQNFRALQDELAGTENRIAVARGRAIKAAQEFNGSARQFPVNIIAKAAGFARKEYYEIPASEQAVPIVNFDKK